MKIIIKRADFALFLLKIVQSTRPDVANVYMAQPNKKMIIFPVIELPKDYDPTTRPWYKNAVEKAGHIAYTDPYKDASYGKIMVSISKAIEDSGKLVGVISMDIDLDKLSNLITQVSIGDKGYAFITDSKGRL